MAGFTPFQFSSNKLQYETTFTVGNKCGVLWDLFTASVSWYDMWINPETINITQSYLNNTTHTANGIVTNHYRPELGIMSVSGKIGWVAIKSLLEEAKDATLASILNPEQALANSNKVFSKFGDRMSQHTATNPAAVTGKTSNINNSPRIFLERLRDLANQPMYYMDNQGIEHYNVKYIKAFTKQFPDGVIFEGFFKTFIIPESAQDAQTVSYNFDFTIENYKPVTMMQRVSGMFSDYGSIIGDAGSVTSGFLGI